MHDDDVAMRHLQSGSRTRLFAGIVAVCAMMAACGGGSETPPSPTGTAPVPSPTPVPTGLPLLDVSNAVPAEVALPLLRQVPGLGETIAAVEAGDADALLALVQLHVVDCDALGRSAGEDCEEVNEAVDGKFDAITVEDAGYRWPLAAVRAHDLLAALLAAGEPRVVAATHDSRTPAGTGGTYYVAVETDPVRLSGPRYGYGDSGATGQGFGLRIEAGADAPIVEFSLLSETWNPLKWLQWGEGNPYHDVIFPPDLNEKYPEVYE